MRRYRLPFLCAAALALSCVHATRDAHGNKAVLDRIRHEIQAVEIAGSTESMRVHISDDVVMMAPNMPPVAGAENAMAAMQQFFDAFTFDIEYKSEEIAIGGDLAFDRGTYRQRLTGRSGSAVVDETGKYLWVYRRGTDGTCKQARVIWNSNQAITSN